MKLPGRRSSFKLEYTILGVLDDGCKQRVVIVKLDGHLDGHTPGTSFGRHRNICSAERPGREAEPTLRFLPKWSQENAPRLFGSKRRGRGDKKSEGERNERRVPRVQKMKIFREKISKIFFGTEVAGNTSRHLCSTWHTSPARILGGLRLSSPGGLTICLLEPLRAQGCEELHLCPNAVCSCVRTKRRRTPTRKSRRTRRSRTRARQSRKRNVTRTKSH
jgi:hypothetical protein